MKKKKESSAFREALCIIEGEDGVSFLLSLPWNESLVVRDDGNCK